MSAVIVGRTVYGQQAEIYCVSGPGLLDLGQALVLGSVLG